MRFLETKIRLRFDPTPEAMVSEQRLLYEHTPEISSGETADASGPLESKNITSERLSEAEFKKRVFSRIEEAARKLDLTWKSGTDGSGFSLDDLNEPKGIARWEKELETREGNEEQIASRDALEKLLTLYTTTLEGAKNLPQTAAQLEQQVAQALDKLEEETKAKNTKYQAEYAMKQTIAERAEANNADAAKVLRADHANQLWRRLSDPLVTEIGRLQSRKTTPGDFLLRIGSLPEEQQQTLNNLRLQAENTTLDIQNGQIPVGLNPLFVEHLAANSAEIQERYLAFVLHHTGLDTPAKEMGYFRTFGSDAYRSDRLAQRELRARGIKKGRHGILESHREARATMRETGEIDDNTSKIWRFSAEKIKAEASFEKFLEAYQVVYFVRKLALPKGELKAHSENSSVHPKTAPDTKPKAAPSASDLLNDFGLTREQLAKKNPEDVLTLIWEKMFAANSQKFAEFAKAGLEEREGKNWIRKFLPSGAITPENLQDALQKMLHDIAPKAGEESRAQQYLEERGLPRIKSSDALNISKLLAYRFELQADGKIYELDGTTLANPENVHRFLKHHQLVSGEYSEQDPKLLWNLLEGKELSPETRARLQADVAKYEQIIQALTPAQITSAGSEARERSGWNWEDFWKLIADLFNLHGGIWDDVREQADESSAERMKDKFSLKKDPNLTPESYVFEAASTLTAEEKKEVETESGIRMALAQKLLAANEIDLPEDKSIYAQFKKNQLTVTFKTETEVAPEKQDWGQIMADRLQPEKAAQNMPEMMKLIKGVVDTEFLGLQITPEDRAAAFEKFIDLTFGTSNYKHTWVYLKGLDLSEKPEMANKMDAIGKFWLKEITGKEFSSAKTNAFFLDNEGNLILNFEVQGAMKFAQSTSQVAFEAESDSRTTPEQSELQFGEPQDYATAKSIIEAFYANS